MCLAIPALIEAIDDENMARVNILGTTRDVSIDLTPHAGIGDYVLVHAGFAIEVISLAHAQETLDLLAQLPELCETDGIS